MRSVRIAETKRAGIVVDCYVDDGLCDVVAVADYEDALHVVMAWLRRRDYDDVATTCQRRLFDDDV